MESIDPFALLQNIADSSKRYAGNLPSQAEAITYWKGVGFILGGKKYVAPLSEVQEILTLPRYTKLPGVHKWVSGVSNVRGRLLPIIDLGNFMGVRASASSRTRRVLVVENGDLLNGVIVDAVLGMQNFPVDTYSERNVGGPDYMANYITGGYKKEGESWPVFSLFSLTQSPSFLQVAV